MPGVDVFGTPGWLIPVLLPVVPGDGEVAAGGGVAGETPGEPAAEPPGEEGGATWADAAIVVAASEAAMSEAIYVALEPPLILEAQHIRWDAVPENRRDAFVSALA